VYNQLQASSRNNATDFKTSWEAIKIAWSWPIWLSPHSKTFRKILDLLILGFVHAVMFAATGLLASRLTTLGNEVLVRSTNCGQWLPGIIAHSSDPKRALYEYSTHLAVNAELFRLNILGTV
jgi:hypothetical protein